MKCKNILEVLRPRLEHLGKVILAGGCVRDEMAGREPKDHDCFVCFGRPVNDSDVETITNCCQDLLPEHGDTAEPSAGGWFLLTDLRIGGKPVQVIASPYHDWQEVVEHFDWRICMYAYDSDYLTHDLRDTVEELGTLRLNVVEYPLSTLRRGFRFCERFKMFIQRDDLRRLCSEVLASVINEQEIEDPSENLEAAF